MTKPLVSLDDVQFDDVEGNGFYTSKRALFSVGFAFSVGRSALTGAKVGPNESS
jgi:hypothetical protein